jgi:predicted PurR-regulated permease PerM
LTVLVGMIVVFGAVAWFTGAALVDESDELTASLDSAVDDIKAWLEDTPVNEELADQIRAAAADAGPPVTAGVADQAVSLLDSAFGLVAGLVLGTIVFALAVNLLLENLLEPVLLGSGLNLHPLLILLAASLGGIIAGMIRLILAAPVLAIDIERELRASGFFDEAPVDLSPERDRVPSSDG